MAQTLYISVTVDWEGRTFDKDGPPYYAENLEGLVLLREKIKALGFDIPWTHYITPNYWLNGTADPTTVLANTKAIDWGKDEIGLHVHCWYDLVQNAQVDPLVENPTFGNMDIFGNDTSGHGVPLGAYSTANIIKIVTKAKTLLEQKLPHPLTVKGFRCGGWMSNDGVLTALMQSDFFYDCSAVPPVVFSQGFSTVSLGNKKDTVGDNNSITDFILSLWGYIPQDNGIYQNTLSLKWNNRQAILPTTQPYKIFANSRSVIEMPNNGGLSDYTSEAYMTAALGDALKLADTSDEPVFLNIGCHQEGPFRYKNSLFEFFDNNKAQLLDLKDQEKIIFSTVYEASRAADLHMVD
ncbi:MAG: hypothetical protein M0Q44_03545 [Methylobacter sp.]|jgi:hypothetical protein|nr:hypothetical protein [Methylobacter sp.]